MFGAYVLLLVQSESCQNMIRLVYRVGHDCSHGINSVRSPQWLLVVLLTCYSKKKQCLHQTASFFLVRGGLFGHSHFFVGIRELKNHTNNNLFVVHLNSIFSTSHHLSAIPQSVALVQSLPNPHPFSNLAEARMLECIAHSEMKYSFICNYIASCITFNCSSIR